MYINIVKQFTGEEPMKSLVADSLEAQGAPGIISTSVAEGYPYADVEEMGMSFLAIADGKTSIWPGRRQCGWRNGGGNAAPRCTSTYRQSARRWGWPSPTQTPTPTPGP